MIEIDGSYGESGGQIIRTSIALSAISGKPCKIFNIREGRKNPGLQAQHLKGVEAASKLCNAELKNAKIGSQEIEFLPKRIKGDCFSIDIGTAGSVTLVLQTLIPICIHADNEIEIEVTGGTAVPWSPSIYYFQHIFCYFLKQMGIDVFVETLRHGFYPKGGGKVRLRVKPCECIKSINLTERGRFKQMDFISLASENLKQAKVAERQAEAAKEVLKEEFTKKEIFYDKTLSPGSLLHLHKSFENCKLGVDVLGERGKSSEKVGEEAAKSLMKQINSNACLDDHMADQILPYIALTKNSKVSVAEITNHCKTNMWVIEKFLPVKFEIKNNIISTKPCISC